MPIFFLRYDLDHFVSVRVDLSLLSNIKKTLDRYFRSQVETANLFSKGYYDSIERVEEPGHSYIKLNENKQQELPKKHSTLKNFKDYFITTLDPEKQNLCFFYEKNTNIWYKLDLIQV